MSAGTNMAIKIFIDQGHNPRNPNAGAEGNGYREQDITYDIGTRLAALLNANPNFSARTSRMDNTSILGGSTSESLRLRVDMAVSWGADAFISLHTNAADSSAPSGCEGYVYSLSSAARPLCEDILNGISDATGLRNRGVQARPTLYVLRKTPMPATLIEMGFITNPRDAQLMAGQPELFARGIYNGIVAFYR